MQLTQVFCVLVLVGLAVALPNPFAIGTKWPQDIQRKQYMYQENDVNKNPWTPILSGYRSHIKEAIVLAKDKNHGISIDDQTYISNNSAKFFSKRYMDQIKQMYNALTDNGKQNDISLLDLVILNIWYDLTTGDASTTLVARQYDFGEGHPVLGFAFNSHGVNNKHSYVARDKTTLQNLAVAVDYIDNNNEVVRTTVTLAGWVGILAGVSYTGSHGYAVTWAANYHYKPIPNMHDLIQSWRVDYLFPSIYMREILEDCDTYTDSINYVKASVHTKLPIFLTIVGSGSIEAEIFVTDGTQINEAYEFDEDLFMMLQDETDVKERVDPSDKWIAVREAINRSNTNLKGFLNNIMKLYPIRDENTVFLMYADPTKGTFGAQLQSCQYIKSFNNDARLVIEACQDPPAPVNLAVPLVSLTLFVIVLSLFGWGVWERRRQMKAEEAQNAYDELSESESDSESD